MIHKRLIFRKLKIVTNFQILNPNFVGIIFKKKDITLKNYVHSPMDHMS